MTTSVWDELADETEPLIVNGRYLIDGKKYTRVTTFIGALDNAYGLSAWKMREVAKGIANSGSLRAELHANVDDHRALDDKIHDGVYGGKTPTQRKRDRQSQPRPSTTTKRCSKCGTVKAIYLFHRRANSPDGHKPHCAACVANYDADRQPRNYSKEARG